ncbi:MAG: hypothetical protein ACOX1P_21420 [Thermoguttaceae bacterium]|jgi:hypothetical protein
MGDQTSKPAAEPVASTTPRRPRGYRSARKGKRRTRAESLARYARRPAPRLCDGMSVFDLASLCFQVEMIRDRLIGQHPLDGEPFTAAQRRNWVSACRFLKAAYTSMNRLMRAYNERRENEVRKRGKRRHRRP